LQEVLAKVNAARLLSDDHFTSMAHCRNPGPATGALAAVMGHQSPDDPRHASVDFPAAPRRNDAHESTTDPDAGVFTKSKGTRPRLANLGHLLTENQHGLIADALVTAATGTAERHAALLMLAGLARRRPHHRRWGSQRHPRFYAPDSRDGHHPHLARFPDTDRRDSAIDRRTVTAGTLSVNKDESSLS
jgi:hypothetical protein